MQSTRSIKSFLVYLGLGFAALGLTQTAAAADPMKAPSIDGTYRFVSRDLPDGTKQQPPDVVGLNTFSHGYRNFNIYWHDAQGKRFSISYVASYKFTGKEYSEKSLYMMVNDEIGGKGISYDLTGPSGKAPVTVDGARISFQFPNYGEPAVVLEGDTFTATRAGVFVDHWVRVR
jgi:hypothetical protein